MNKVTVTPVLPYSITFTYNTDFLSLRSYETYCNAQSSSLKRSHKRSSRFPHYSHHLVHLSRNPSKERPRSRLLTVSLYLPKPHFTLAHTYNAFPLAAVNRSCCMPTLQSAEAVSIYQVEHSVRSTTLNPIGPMRSNTSQIQRQ